MNSFLAEAVPARQTAPGGYAVGLVAPDHATTKRLLRALRGDSFHVESVAYTLGELAIESKEFELDAIVLHSGRDLTQLPTTIAEFRRRAAGVSIVVVTRSVRRQELRHALNADIDGLIYESQMSLTLPIALHAARFGQFSIPREVRAQVDRPALSYRERQVLAGVAKELTNREIATQMSVSPSTVKAHLGAAFTKLGVSSRREAAAALLEGD